MHRLLLLTTCFLTLTVSSYAQCEPSCRISSLSEEMPRLSEEMNDRELLRARLSFQAERFVASGIFENAQHAVEEGFRTLNLDGLSRVEKDEAAGEDSFEYLKNAIASLGDGEAVQEALAFVDKSHAQAVSSRERYVNAVGRTAAERAMLCRWERVTEWVMSVAVALPDVPLPVRGSGERIQEAAFAAISGRSVEEPAISGDGRCEVLADVDFSTGGGPLDFLCVGYVRIAQTNILRI
ncbi:MAG: hypothetical protein Q4D98_09815 [Planctomycetia bacterium]|nr:hypothetical protein [Planctomycetia bacterium]